MEVDAHTHFFDTGSGRYVGNAVRLVGQLGNTRRFRTMGYHTRPLAKEVPNAASRVSLCFDRQKTIVWLELTTSEINSPDAELPYTTHFIGATNNGSGWNAIMPHHADRERSQRLDFGTKLCNQAFQNDEHFRTEQFQQAIINDWKSFDGSERFAKGLTFGTDVSGPSFVMKALKTGFDAMGAIVSVGMRLTGFTVDDVIEYMNRRAGSFPTQIDPHVADFEEFAPLRYSYTENAEVSDTRAIPAIESKARKVHGGRFAYANETTSVPFPRVIGFGFRGDNRLPSEVKEAGGMNPNYTRPDHIEKATLRGSPQNQALDLPKFLNDQFYGGYVSVSKSMKVARGFACNMGATQANHRRSKGWVYACFVEGAFNIPLPGTIRATPTHPEIVIRLAEQELAFPGLLDWADIVGCRMVDSQGSLLGNIYLRRSLFENDRKAGIQILKLLSGKPQGMEISAKRLAVDDGA